MAEIEKLLNRQVADTKHAVRGGSFNRFDGRRVALPIRKSDTDETGLDILSWHKGA